MNDGGKLAFFVCLGFGLITSSSARAETLEGNSNYFLYSPGNGSTACRALPSLEVKVKFDSDIVSNTGFGLQLNALAPPSSIVGYQQYIVGFTPENKICTECGAVFALRATAELWPDKGNTTLKGNYINATQIWDGAVSGNVLPKNTEMIIDLTADSSHGNVIRWVQFTIKLPRKEPIQTAKIDLTTEPLKYDGAPKPPQAAGFTYLSPITAFELNFVGAGDSQWTYVSQGKGSFTYATPADAPLVPKATLPANCAFTNVFTTENSNVTYSTLPSTPGSSVVQGFEYKPLPPYLPGGPIAAAAHAGGPNSVYVVSANQQLVEMLVDSTGHWRSATGLVAQTLVHQKAGVVARQPNGATGETDLFSVDGWGDAVEYIEGSVGNWVKLHPIPNAPSGVFSLSQTIEPSSGLSSSANFSLARAASTPPGSGTGSRNFFVVDTSGQLEVSSLPANSSRWGTPFTLGKSGAFANGAPVAALPLFTTTDIRTEVLIVDQNETIEEFFYTGTSGRWTAATPAPQGTLPDHAQLAAAYLPGSLSSLMLAGVNQQQQLVAIPFSSASGWGAPSVVNGSSGFSAGGALALTQLYGPTGNLALLAVDDTSSSQLRVYTLPPHGSWSAPRALGRPGLAPPGSFIATVQDSVNENQTDAFLIDNDGYVQMFWFDGDWHGPKSAEWKCSPGYHNQGPGKCVPDSN